MKKLGLLSVLFLCGMLFSSCGNELACHEVEMSYEVAGEKFEITSYVYGTKNDLDLAIEQLEKAQGEHIDVNIKTKRVNKSAADCVSSNLD